MTSPKENDNYDPSNNPPANISPLHQNQVAGFRITENANEMNFSNSINHIRNMHEVNRARAQNMPMVNQEAGLHITENANEISFSNSVNYIRNMHEDDRARAQNMPMVNQEAGFHITENANEMSFSNSVNHIRNMHEDDRARAQNIPMLNLMHPPIYPLMASNIRGGSFQSPPHPVMINVDNVRSGGSQSNRPQRPQIDRSSLSVRGNTAEGFVPSSQWHGMGTGTNFRPDSVTFNGMFGPQIDRNMVTVGANMNAAYQYRDQQELMVRNQVINAVPSSNPTCPEQTLNLGFGDATVTTFPSNVHVGIPSSNGMAVTPYSFLRPQVDGSSLRLGGNFGDLNWPNDNSGNMLGTNAGFNPIEYSTLQRPQGDVQHCYPIQGHRIFGIGSNRGLRNVNLGPYGGSHGYSGTASGQLSGIQALMLADEQARRARVAQLFSTPTQIPNEFVPTQLQQARLSNTRSILTNSSMVSPFGTVGSTIGRDHSGHTRRPFDATAAQEAKHSTSIADMKEQAQQTTRGTSHVPCKGKRSPAEGSQYAQSAKVLLGASVSSGKPVPVPVGSALKPVPVRPQHVAKSRLMATTSAIPSFPQHKRTPQFISRPTSSLDHIKWKGSTKSPHSIDENCALCKRNLTFTPTGPVSQPSIPPEVAVLPCGHTFHDECLQRITPPEQSKDPPCIPCALNNF